MHIVNAPHQNLLMVFVRNPELGKCKTRLAATIGDCAALDIYLYLLRHTASFTQNVEAHKEVHYSHFVDGDDLWDAVHFHKKLQQGADLGARMQQGFADGFAQGHQKIIIIGSDMYQLGTEDINHAFGLLDTHDYVLGPAADGGYYLLGMKQPTPALFQHKNWGTNTVLQHTLEDLKGTNTALLEIKNDIDTYDDVRDEPVFRTYLNHMQP